MIRTITAEFQSIDQAEYASKTIKEKVDGIERIAIKADNKTKNEFNPFGHSAVINSISPTVPGSIFITNVRFPNFYDATDNPVADTFSNETQQNSKVILEIHCKDENASKVSSLITALGGLRIKNL